MARRRVLREAVLGAAGLASLAWASPVMATGGSNGAHRLKAYDLHAYGSWTDARTGGTSSWKLDYCSNCSYTANKWFSTWLYNTLVTNCNGGAACGHTNSVLRRDAASTVDLFHVDVRNNNADLVIFMGHHISIRERIGDSGFDAWVPWDSARQIAPKIVTGAWTNTIVSPISDWGTNTVPFYYHQRGTDFGSTDYNGYGIQDAQFGTQTSPPQPSVCWNETYGNVHCTPSGGGWAASYGVQYMHKPLTSVLIGQDYGPGLWVTENENIPGSAYTVRQGQLGSGINSTTNGVKWYIGNGCQLVPVAWYSQENGTSGDVYASNKGKQQWMRSWDGAHIAMGHWDATTSTCQPNMVNVGNSMMGGVDMVMSYFDQHSSTASECHQANGRKGFGMPAAVGPDGNILWYETWTSPWANPSHNGGEWVSYYEVAE